MSRDGGRGLGIKVRLKKDRGDYFAKKYGEATPEFEIEGKDTEVFGQSWATMRGNPAAMLYAITTGPTDIPFDGTVWYGHIKGIGELVHESEIEWPKKP